MSNHPEASPVTSLHYFAGLIEEVRNTDVGMDYWRYLAARVKKMEAHCRAQANFAGANGFSAKETK